VLDDTRRILVVVATLTPAEDGNRKALAAIADGPLSCLRKVGCTPDDCFRSWLDDTI
jgi:hypothetical protein